jgi:general secretion pathway protein L
MADDQKITEVLAMDTQVIASGTDMPAAPPGVRFLPGENVLLLVVAMPQMPLVQRRAAAGFAIEDKIARPLEDVHVILGPKMSGLATDGNTHWLVAVIERQTLAQAPAKGKQRLLPDTLALPVPAAGQWSVWAGRTRALVRTSEGAGFATALSALPVYHLAAGHPEIVLYGGTLDAPFSPVRTATLPDRIDAGLDRFDLNAQRNDGAGKGLPRVWRHVAALAVVAALGHIGLLAADTWALGQTKAAQVAALRGTLEAIGQPAGDDIDAAIGAALARTNGTRGPRFVPMMSRVFAALGAQSGMVTLSDLRYIADQNSLTLTMQAPDLGTLQTVETTLVAAGFAVTVGAATTGNGLAEQQLTLQGDGT